MFHQEKFENQGRGNMSKKGDLRERKMFQRIVEVSRPVRISTSYQGSSS